MADSLADFGDLVRAALDRLANLAFDLFFGGHRNSFRARSAAGTTRFNTPMHVCSVSEPRATTAGSIQPCPQLGKRFTSLRIVWHDRHGLLELLERFEPVPFAKVNAAHIQVWEV